jgi:hypothetical protein
MLQFFSILLRNAWRGVRRANVLPAIILMTASLGVLLVGGSAAASGPEQTPTHFTAQTVTHARRLAFMPSVVNGASLPNHKNVKKPRPNVGGQLAANVPTAQPSNQPAPGQTSPDQNTSANAPTTVQLSQLTPTCQQGQPGFAISSAQLSLPAPTAEAGTLTWYWESDVVSGSNNSSTSPMSASQTSQSLPAGTSQITLPANNQASPLVTAPQSSNYAYIFRLHITIGSTDYVSTWQNVPEASTASCQQN